MAAKSEIILSNRTHPAGSDAESVIGEKFKGDGYYGRSDGIHTVQWTLANFRGSISIQGSLAIDPIEADWFKARLGKEDEYTIDTTGRISKSVLTTINYTDSTTGSFSYNFTGNYVWVRARIEDWTTGSINSIILSH
jgi:hypothetical protein